jgi:hypothetical protein
MPPRRTSRRKTSGGAAKTMVLRPMRREQKHNPKVGVTISRNVKPVKPKRTLGMPATHNSMPATHNSMPATHNSMPATHNSMPATHNSALDRETVASLNMAPQFDAIPSLAVVRRDYRATKRSTQTIGRQYETLCQQIIANPDSAPAVARQVHMLGTLLSVPPYLTVYCAETEERKWPKSMAFIEMTNHTIIWTDTPIDTRKAMARTELCESRRERTANGSRVDPQSFDDAYTEFCRLMAKYAIADGLVPIDAGVIRAHDEEGDWNVANAWAISRQTI